MASRATSLIEFQLVFGLAVGGSAAAIFAPMMACVTGWFDTHRSLAVSLVSAGMGMAPITMSPLAAWLVSNYDWRTSLLIIAAFVAAVMIPVALLVRRPPALEAQNTFAASVGEVQRVHVCGASDQITSVHHTPFDELLLLRHPFGSDFPHGELRNNLRHSDDCSSLYLQH